MWITVHLGVLSWIYANNNFNTNNLVSHKVILYKNLYYPNTSKRRRSYGAYKMC